MIFFILGVVAALLAAFVLFFAEHKATAFKLPTYVGGENSIPVLNGLS